MTLHWYDNSYGFMLIVVVVTISTDICEPPSSSSSTYIPSTLISYGSFLVTVAETERFTAADAFFPFISLLRSGEASLQILNSVIDSLTRLIKSSIFGNHLFMWTRVTLFCRML